VKGVVFTEFMSSPGRSRSLLRERTARKEAESLLEQKSSATTCASASAIHHRAWWPTRSSLAKASMLTGTRMRSLPLRCHNPYRYGVIATTLPMTRSARTKPQYRLSKLLSRLSPEQSSFRAGHCVLDGLLIAEMVSNSVWSSFFAEAL
jgi:hypothetical protein